MALFMPPSTDHLCHPSPCPHTAPHTTGQKVFSMPKEKYAVFMLNQREKVQQGKLTRHPWMQRPHRKWLSPKSRRKQSSCLLFWNECRQREEGHQKGRHSPRQGAGRVRLPGRDRWRADTPGCTWSRNVDDDRSTCGLEPSPVSSGRTMTGMCVQSIATVASPYPLSLSEVPEHQRTESKKQNDKLNAE